MIHICLILFFLLLLPQATAVMKVLSSLVQCDRLVPEKRGVSVDDICCYLQVLSYNSKYKQNPWKFFGLLINYFILSGEKNEHWLK